MRMQPLTAASNPQRRTSFVALLSTSIQSSSGPLLGSHSHRLAWALLSTSAVSDVSFVRQGSKVWLSARILHEFAKGEVCREPLWANSLASIK